MAGVSANETPLDMAADVNRGLSLDEIDDAISYVREKTKTPDGRYSYKKDCT